MNASLYIHAPYCASKCAYCDFYSVSQAESLRGGRLPAESEDRFIEGIRRQLAAQRLWLNAQSWDTVYIGGGNPGLLSARAARELLGAINSFAPARAGAEITIEANPENIDGEWIDSCAAAGVNRFSVGIQSLYDPALRAAQRSACAARAVKALETLNRARDKNPRLRFSADIIAGLPQESERTFADGLNKTLSYEPDHISLYTLTIERGTPLDKSLRAAGSYSRSLKDIEERAESQWFIGRDLLLKAGFEQYETSNFARAGRECAHNLVYWSQGNWLAAGPSASASVTFENASELPRAQNLPQEARALSEAKEFPIGARFGAPGDLALWLREPERMNYEILDKRTLLLEALMTGFRMSRGVNLARFEKRFGAPLSRVLEPIWREYEDSGRIAARAGFAALNADERLFLNRFLLECARCVDLYENRGG